VDAPRVNGWMLRGLMFQDDNVTGIYTAPFFVRIDLEAVPVESPYPIILILKIDDTVALLK
jgi:hypothetical protein